MVRIHHQSPQPSIQKIQKDDRAVSAGAKRCRRKFLHYYPGGFRDPDYIGLERGYKQSAHERWAEALEPTLFRNLAAHGGYRTIADTVVRIESRTNLLFSFEKMALRDALKPAAGARDFAFGLYDFLYGRGGGRLRFERWIETLAGLPRKQTRVLTWPVATVFGFLAKPQEHFFLKPNVVRRAALAYGFDLHYQSRPAWDVYAGVLEFCRTVERDLRDLKPRDRIDIQSFLWVQGSDEYPD